MATEWVFCEVCGEALVGYPLGKRPQKVVCEMCRGEDKDV